MAAVLPGAPSPLAARPSARSSSSSLELRHSLTGRQVKKKAVRQRPDGPRALQEYLGARQSVLNFPKAGSDRQTLPWDGCSLNRNPSLTLTAAGWHEIRTASRYKAMTAVF